jgi:hypothetical protein
VLERAAVVAGLVLILGALALVLSNTAPMIEQARASPGPRAQQT